MPQDYVPPSSQVLGTFSNGRVEAYMSGLRHLEPPEMAAPERVPAIARRLAQFHAVELPEERKPNLFATISKWCACDLAFGLLKLINHQSLIIMIINIIHSYIGSLKLSPVALPADKIWTLSALSPE